MLDAADALAEAVAAWHAANHKNRRGANDYTLQEYGLRKDEVAERFAPYIERFAIPREREGLR